MIYIENLSKSFEETKAVHQVSLTIPDSRIFGILGTNGAGKSTLLRMMSGIIRSDAGQIQIDGEAVWDNLNVKQKLFYLPDEPYYFPNATLGTMKEFYGSVYPRFDKEGFEELIKKFELDENKKIRTFSKGMRRQAFILAAICANTKYILCDEVFDGLDAVVSKVIKALFRQEMEMRKLTLVMASHNLHELEDFCDTVGIMQKGGILMSGEIRAGAEKLHKIQCVFREDKEAVLKESLRVIKYEKEGMFVTMVVEGEQTEIVEILQKQNPICFERFPLSIEEIFLCKIKEAGDDIRQVFS